MNEIVPAQSAAVTASGVIRNLLQPATRRRALRNWHSRVVTNDGAWTLPFEARYFDSQFSAARDFAWSSPSFEMLQADVESFRTAAEDRVTIEQTTVLVAWMLDGYPSARITSLESFVTRVFSSIEFDEDDVPISASSLAIAIERLQATSTFVPSIAELLTAAKKARADLDAARIHTEYLIKLKTSAIKMLKDVGDAE